MELLIVTGMSGAGKSKVIANMEDIGFYCVDNMTPELIPTFVKILNESYSTKDKVAIVADIRLGNAFNHLFNSLEELKKMNCNYKILFLDADNDVILRRYKETRRRHPLTTDDSYEELLDIIIRERKVLEKAKNIADFVIDTSMLSTGELKERVVELFMDGSNKSMRINVMSFGFKYGSPKDADLLFDVRCLPNPFYVPDLKEKTGLEEPVREYVMRFDEAKGLVPRLLDLIDYLAPLYVREGKSQLTVAVGCTGGKHRSVVFAEIVKNELVDKGFNAVVHHRDIKR